MTDSTKSAYCRESRALDLCCAGFVLFVGMINAGKIWPIEFRADGTRHDPIRAWWHRWVR